MIVVNHTIHERNCLRRCRYKERLESSLFGCLRASRSKGGGINCDKGLSDIGERADWSL